MKKIAYLVALFALLIVAGGCKEHKKFVPGPNDTIALAKAPVASGQKALEWVKKQCAFGPRVSGTETHRQCGDYLIDEFKKLGLEVKEQTAEATRYDGQPVPLRNIIASMNPDNADRILLCAHYDTRPWADHDPDEANHRLPLLGANDGASGVAVLLEIARCLQTKPIKTGIDFVLFDAEDMGTPEWAENDSTDTAPTWCLGSQAWATQAFEETYQARFGVLFDMVGGQGTTFAHEGASMRSASTIVEILWQLGKQLGYEDLFQDRDGGHLVDDHVPVNDIARIPCIDIVGGQASGITFAPTWHTMQDTPEHIDPLRMQAAAQVVLQLLYNDAAAM